MQTTIDNNQRVFQLVDSLGRSYFCNLYDLPTLIKSLELKDGYYTVYHFWNAKPKRASKSYLNQMFQANQINFKL